MLGVVEKVSASGKLILRASGKLVLRVGQKVYDGNKQVGFIWDVIGPVQKPFVLVEVESGPNQFVGKKLFLR